MSGPFQLELSEYEALVALARRGISGDVEKLRQLNDFLRIIEQKNGVVRDFLWVQWTETDSPLPKGTQFPETWPPEQRFYIELTTRRVAKVDVEAVLAQKAKKPIDVLVTRDPGARVGWTEVDAFFPTG